MIQKTVMQPRTRWWILKTIAIAPERLEPSARGSAGTGAGSERGFAVAASSIASERMRGIAVDHFYLCRVEPRFQEQREWVEITWTHVLDRSVQSRDCARGAGMSELGPGWGNVRLISAATATAKMQEA